MAHTLPAERVAGEVRAAMGRNRTSQSVLAPAIGLSQAALSRRLRGEVEFTVTELSAIAGYFGIPLTDLLPQPQAVA